MRALLLAVSLLFPLAGAARADSVAVPAAKPAAPAPVAAKPAPVAVPKPVPQAPATVVKLLDAGKGKLAPLRYTLRAGAKQRMTMTMTMGMQLTLGKNAMPAQELPPMQATIKLAVASVTPAGDYAIQYEYEKTKVLPSKSDPAAKAAMEAALKDIDGLKGSAVISPRGLTREAKAEIPASVSEQNRQLIENLERAVKDLAVPFPEEAVGVGARWQTSSPIEMNGMRVEQTTTVELAERKGNRVKLKVDIVQRAEKQTIEKNGMSMELKSLDSKGGGEQKLDVGKLVPAASQVTMKSNMSAAAMGQDIGMVLDLKVELQGK